MPKRTLPIYHMDGTPYYVDVDQDCLVQTSHPDDIIWLKDTRYSAKGYEFWIDTETGKQVFSENDARKVLIPPLKQLDPHGMARRYKKSLQQVARLTDFEIIVDASMLRKRTQGNLPQLKLGDTLYTVHLKAGVLCAPGQYPSGRKGIPLATFSQFIMGVQSLGKDSLPLAFQYVVPINTNTGQPADTPFFHPLELPAHVHLVAIPTEPFLDPLGYARMNGLNMAQHLRFHPPVDVIVANNIPWKDIARLQIFQKQRSNKRATDPKPRTLPDDSNQRPLRRKK